MCAIRPFFSLHQGTPPLLRECAATPPLLIQEIYEVDPLRCPRYRWNLSIIDRIEDMPLILTIPIT